MVVDDDPDMTAALDAYLSGEGFQVTTSVDGAQALEIMRARPAQLVLLDLMLPGEDGFSIIRELRKFSEAGVIIITGKRSEVDRVVGLELGADDYILKPFELREVLARIRSVLRRCGPRAAAAPALLPPGLAKCRLDTEARQLLPRAGAAIPLTAAECVLMEQFLLNPGKALSRDALMRAVNGRDWEYLDRSIDILVARLRRKLSQLPQQPFRIQTIRGSGYLLASDAGLVAQGHSIAPA